MDKKKKSKKRANKYEKKIIIKGDLDSVLKVLIANPSPLLVKRKGNTKKEKGAD